MNSEKLRKVEFHFFSKDYDQVITPILDHIQAEELPAFQFDCIEHDVAIWKADLHFEGKTVTMQRQEGFDATQFPRYFLTMTEPVTDLKTGSFIEFIRNCYKGDGDRHAVLEYDFRGEQN
ncbi:MAG: hypothetical protein IPP17_29595 [Bacteroidetes bacterium]|nr:hypothetical protein [Bacteroidota bacterium]